MFAYSAESRFPRAWAPKCGRYWKRSPAMKLRGPLTKRASCARMSRRSSSELPLTVASAA